MAALASFIGSPQDREHWSHCVDAIRTGESVVPKLRGMEGFDWFASDPEVFDVFNQAMTNFSEMAVAPVTAAYDFSGYRTIVDVGGGHGRLLAGILASAPTAKGILFDLPHVVAGAGRLLCKHNVADRVRGRRRFVLRFGPRRGRPVRDEEHHPRLARRQGSADSQNGPRSGPDGATCC